MGNPERPNPATFPDKIIIRDLHLRTVIGINDWERKNRQDIIINIEIAADLREAGRSDDINRTVNYRTITKEVVKMVESAQRFTVEVLAADIAAICLNHEGCEHVAVRVEKPGAVRFARAVGVEISRWRHDHE